MLEVIPCNSSAFYTLPLGLCAISFVLQQYVRHPQDDEFLPKPFSFCLLWIPWNTNAVDEGLDLLFHLPVISFILMVDSAFSTAICPLHFRPVITEGLVFSQGGRASHAASGKVTLYLIYIPQQVTTSKVLASSIKYIVPHLLRS